MRRIRKRIKQHIIDSTAILAVTTPLSAFTEKVIVGMSTSVSLKARLLMIIIFFLGYGGLLGWLRDWSRRKFSINAKTREQKQQFHDMLFIALTSAFTNLVIYLIAGSRDLTEILMSTGLNAGIGLAFGGVIGYSIDLFRLLFGVQKSVRVPAVLWNSSVIKKRIIGALLVSIVLVMTLLIYIATPD